MVDGGLSALLKKTQERSLEVKVCIGVNIALRDLGCASLSA